MNREPIAYVADPARDLWWAFGLMVTGCLVIVLGGVAILAYSQPDGLIISDTSYKILMHDR